MNQTVPQKAKKMRPKSLLAAFGAFALATLVGQTANAQNYARYLILENCGGYQIHRVDVLARNFEDKKWSLIGHNVASFGTGYGICFDMKKLLVDQAEEGETLPTDEAKLKGYIGLGDSRGCDSTNLDLLQSGAGVVVRRYRMKGTTWNNNGCRSRKYDTKNEETMSEMCSHGGRIFKVQASCG